MANTIGRTSIQQRAAATIARAVTTGKLPRLDGSVACRDCGQPAQVYDHRQYAEPLKADAVCRKCNKRRGPALDREAPTGSHSVLLRLPDDLHDIVRIAAAGKRRSLNAWICDQLRGAVLREGHREKAGPVAAILNQMAAAGPPSKPNRRS